jgi:hypothetical protein
MMSPDRGAYERTDDAHGYLLVGDAAVDDLVRANPDSLRWVVIDDLDSDVAELAISPWPRLDNDGRLRFAEDEDDYAFGIMPTAELQERLDDARRRQDPPLDARPLRVGDALAAQLVVDEDGRASLADGHPAPLADVTLASRTFAKTQEAAADDAAIDASLIREHEDT